jgi:hypothetical protein
MGSIPQPGEHFPLRINARAKINPTGFSAAYNARISCREATVHQ